MKIHLPLPPTSPLLGLQVPAIMPDFFYLVSWNPHSGPHTGKTSYLPTESPCQPQDKNVCLHFISKKSRAQTVNPTPSSFPMYQLCANELDPLESKIKGPLAAPSRTDTPRGQIQGTSMHMHTYTRTMIRETGTGTKTAHRHPLLYNPQGTQEPGYL